MKLTEKQIAKVEALKANWMGEVYDAKNIRALIKENKAQVARLEKILAIIAPPKVAPTMGKNDGLGK